VAPYKAFNDLAEGHSWRSRCRFLGMGCDCVALRVANHEVARPFSRVSVTRGRMELLTPAPRSRIGAIGGLRAWAFPNRSSRSSAERLESFRFLNLQ
jgi:hypothetical protein